MSYAVGWGTIKKTRKPHQCQYCGETILAGSSCYHARGFYEGTAWTIHMHHECEPLTNDWDEDDWGHIEPGTYQRPITPTKAKE